MPDRDAAEAKGAVLETSRRLEAKGLVEGTSGNVSARMPDGTVCITPSSVPYETMTLDDLVVVDLDGAVVGGSRAPSSEQDLHLANYRAFEEIGGVIHSHPVHATMFALVHEPIPAAIEEFVVHVGGDVRCCPYRTTGTPALADEVVANLEDRSAVLLANHGMVSVGATPEQALHTAAVVERTARIVWGARMLGRVAAIPREVNDDFAGVYRFVREHP